MTHLVENPKLLDVVLNKLQLRLSELAWLKDTYGKCYTYTDVKNKNRKLPVIYKRKGDYIHLTPYDLTGNTSFFTVAPESNYEGRKGFPGMFSSKVGLILWVRVTDVSSSYNTEDIKSQVMSALRGYVDGMSEIDITGTSEGLKSVYKEFDLNFTDQPDMYPYYVLRVNMNIKYKELC